MMTAIETVMMDVLQIVEKKQNVLAMGAGCWKVRYNVKLQDPHVSELVMVVSPEEDAAHIVLANRYPRHSKDKADGPATPVVPCATHGGRSSVQPS